jgi:hypothetical protein
MVPLMVDEAFAEQVNLIAAKRGETVQAILWQMLETYPSCVESQRSYKALMAMNGMIDSDITDASTTIRETMDAYYREKFGHSD